VAATAENAPGQPPLLSSFSARLEPFRLGPDYCDFLSVGESFGRRHEARV
jgi:hypothetical protein